MRDRTALTSTLLSLSLAATALPGCLDNPGVDPPPGELNFPTAAALSPSAAGASPRWLYVANSNFDLRYNAGSLHAYDLDRLDACLADLGCDGSQEPEACEIVDARFETGGCAGLLADEVLLGSFADALVLGPGGRRLYLPVRSDSDLAFVDLDEAGSTFSCAAEGDPPRCGDDFRHGDGTAATARGIETPPDPVDLYVGSLEADFGRPAGAGNYVVMVHRGGSASLFLDESVGGGAKPRLVHALAGLPEELVTLQRHPNGLFWATSASIPLVTRLGVALDSLTSDLEASFLYDAGALRISGVDTGAAGVADTRDIRFDPVDPSRGYVLSRRPRALFFVDVDASVGRLEMDDAVDVGFGPSRLDVARVLDRTLAFVSDFDSRDLYVLDTELRRLVGVVRGLSGPFELRVDASRERIYVVDFRASVIRVVDLAPLRRCLDGESTPGDECTPLVVGTIGRPRPVVELR